MTKQSKQGLAQQTSRPASFHRKKISALLLVAGLASAGLANAGAVISFGNTSLGVNDTGELNFSGMGPGGFGTYGVYRAGVGDAISPGCLCEGWGVALTTRDGFTAAGFANQAAGSGGLTGGTFGSTSTTATSQVSLSEVPVSVRHAFGPSLATDVLQAQVTITNNSANTVSNVTYRRAMDWDVPPTEFNEYVTHVGVQANLLANGGNVKFASNNGFASSDPRINPGELGGSGGGGGEGGEFFIDGEIMAAASAPPTTINVDFTDAGPNDHGSVFDFDFGDLAPGASRIFNIFYGSASSEAGALAAIAKLAPNVYSLGQNSAPGGETDGTPATFIFAFGGVGGVEPGSDPDNPILPFVPAPGVFEFDAPQSGRWFDPPMADGFVVELFGDDAEFTEVELAPGFMNLILALTDGTILDSDLDAGELFSFAPGVTAFKIFGLNPDVDASDTRAFPLWLSWDGIADSMRWTAIESDDPTEVPEPGILALLGIGLAGIARRRFVR